MYTVTGETAGSSHEWNSRHGGRLRTAAGTEVKRVSYTQKEAAS